MKNIRSVVYLFLIIVLFIAVESSAQTVASQPSEKKSYFNIGLIWGYPFSDLPGLRLEVTPIEYLGFHAAVGVSELQKSFFEQFGTFTFGWSVGLTAYFLGSKSKLSPFLAGHYGIVATTVQQGPFGLYYERFRTGTAISVGVRYKEAYAGFFLTRSYTEYQYEELRPMIFFGFYVGANLDP
jgi:hypothetical protein